MVFTKPARAGFVKTRLTSLVSAEQAAQLHRALLGDLVELLSPGDFDLKIAWSSLPETTHLDFAIPVVLQAGEDLGARLFSGLASQIETYRYVAAVGSDHPDLSLSLVDRAFDKLAQGSDLVFGPALDGGYYLVAVTAHSLRRELFVGIDWSTATVLRSTLDRCRRLGLSYELLPERADVDTPADLLRLAATLTREPAGGGSRTRTLLRSWKMIPKGRSEGKANEDP